MATSSAAGRESDRGVIILGNSGAGKSFIANLLIGEQIFKSEYQAEAVTTVTRNFRIHGESHDILIFDIPGMIEADQARIDGNIKEIEKAFKECPNSYVIFVCSVIGGRPPNNDVTAFNALNAAYRFPEKSLMFIVNNVRPNRPPKFEAGFGVALGKYLKREISMRDIFFMETFDNTDQERCMKYTKELLAFVHDHQANKQVQYQNIMLLERQIAELSDKLDKEFAQAAADRVAFQAAIARKDKEWQAAKEKMETRNSQLEAEIRNLQGQVRKDGFFSTVTKGALAGGVTGGTAGLLGGPLGATALAPVGAVVGGVSAGASHIVSTLWNYFQSK